ncbi:ribosomal RNA small subunit methyltransferase A [bacterium]|nr:ribosomal RNA small subunit methyltransferase A [bacterium]
MLEAYIHTALERARIRPSKARGQHFLIDDGVLAQIVRAAQLDSADAVLEIGPGLGSLTQSLAARCWRVYAFELDDAIVKYLRGWVLPETRNVVLDDIAFNKYALERVIAEVKAEGRRLKIVTNLPYQISSAFLHTVVEYSADIDLTVVMLQREVALRACAGVGDPGYNSFSLYLQTWLKPRWVCDVPRGAFYPEPQVESAVITLTPLKPQEQPQPRDRRLYDKMVKGIFRRRRKTILNALQLTYGHLSSEQALAALRSAGIDPQKRPQDLGMAEYVKLADALAG